MANLGTSCLIWLTRLIRINAASRIRLAKARGDKVGFWDAAACGSCPYEWMDVIQTSFWRMMRGVGMHILHERDCTTCSHRECALQIVDG